MAAPDQQWRFENHTGRWTEGDFLALPVDRRIELLDGSLLMSPTSSHRHQWLALRLAQALNAAAPDGVRAIGPTNVRLGPDRILIPDVAVIPRPRRDASVSDAADVLLVVEIVSPGNAFMDRAVKPALYAQAGIESYLRIELQGTAPVGHLSVRDGETYREIARGSRIELAEPFAVALDLAALDDLED